MDFKNFIVQNFPFLLAILHKQYIFLAFGAHVLAHNIILKRGYIDGVLVKIKILT